MGGVISAVSGKAPKPDKEAHKGEYSDELMTRILGSIDRYLDQQGVRDYVPTEDRPRQWATTGSDKDLDNRELEDEEDDREYVQTIAPRKPSGTFGPLPALVDSLREARPELYALFNKGQEEPKMLDMALARAIEARKQGGELQSADLKGKIVDPAEAERARKRQMGYLRGGR